MSPNTIKAILNKEGLDQTSSISSRAFELFSEGKPPLDVAITLGLKAEDAIRYHQEYYMLLGCNEFTKVYLRIKDNPWPFVKPFKLAQNSGMSEGEVVELLKVANGHLPGARFEYERIKAEINSLEAEKSNSVRIYQQFCDRNREMNKRIDELQLTINELEDKKAELQKSTLNEPLPEPQESKESNTDNENLNLEVKEEEVILLNYERMPPPNMVINHINENETLHDDYSLSFPINGPNFERLTLPYKSTKANIES